jgi:hypothetical protein
LFSSSSPNKIKKIVIKLKENIFNHHIKKYKKQNKQELAEIYDKMAFEKENKISSLKK